MAYTVKEIYYTLQGEGAHTGRPAVFLRFAGCNLWSGREQDRPKAICQFCDTDFIGTDGPGGGQFKTPQDLAQAVFSHWPPPPPEAPPPLEAPPKPLEPPESPEPPEARPQKTSSPASPKPTLPGKPYVVCTGGEPLLQLDEAAIGALQALGFEVAVETNGTQKAPTTLDWICVSPKAGTQLIQTTGSELKLVYPQRSLKPEQVAHLDFKHFYLQPMDTADPQKAKANVQAAIDYCLKNPQWRLSIQTHKALDIA